MLPSQPELQSWKARRMRVWANLPQLVSCFSNEAATSVQTAGQVRGRRLRAETGVVAVRTARARDMGRIVVKRSEYRWKLDSSKREGKRMYFVRNY